MEDFWIAQHIAAAAANDDWSGCTDNDEKEAKAFFSEVGEPVVLDAEPEIRVCECLGVLASCVPIKIMVYLHWEGLDLQVRRISSATLAKQADILSKWIGTMDDMSGDKEELGLMTGLAETLDAMLGR